MVISKEFGIPGDDFFRRNGLDPKAPRGQRYYRWSLIRNLVWEHAYDDGPPPDL